MLVYIIQAPFQFVCHWQTAVFWPWTWSVCLWVNLGVNLIELDIFPDVTLSPLPQPTFLFAFLSSVSPAIAPPSNAVQSTLHCTAVNTAELNAVLILPKMHNIKLHPLLLSHCTAQESLLSIVMLLLFSFYYAWHTQLGGYFGEIKFVEEKIWKYKTNITIDGAVVVVIVFITTIEFSFCHNLMQNYM